MAAYVLINQQHHFDLALTQLREAKVVAVDIESSGYYTYFQELCLIQLSSGKYHYIIDTLCNLNLDELGKVFSNKKILKIFHGAANDIAELHKTFNWEINNIFDTLSIGRLLGHSSCSLASLVQEYTGMNLSKKEQKSNWKKRPLTRSQLNYAHLDTVYLDELRTKMIEELQNTALLEELEYDFLEMTTKSRITDKNHNGDKWMKIHGALLLNPVRRGYLKRLYEIREIRAKKENIAPFRLLTNEGLLNLANKMPVNIETVNGMKMANPLFLKKDAIRLVAAAGESHPVSDESLPQQPEVDIKTRTLLKQLKRWRDKIALFRGMDNFLILSNRILFKIAETRPESLKELGEMNLLNKWKFEKYGEQIIQVIKSTYRGDIPSDLPKINSNRRKLRDKTRATIRI